MGNELAIKTFDVDYSFIIKNYLDKELWHKTWTLLQYKAMTVKISLWRIDIYDDSVYFKIEIDNLQEHHASTTIYFFIDKCEIKFLKNKINSAIISCLESIEAEIIRENIPETFDELEKLEEKIIEKTVKEYLNDKDISSDAIIDSVIDNCRDEFIKSSDYKQNYVYGMKYKTLSEYFDVVSNALDKEIKNSSDINSYENLKNARVRLSVIKETEKMQEEIINYLDGEEYDINLGLEMEE